MRRLAIAVTVGLADVAVMMAPVAAADPMVARHETVGDAIPAPLAGLAGDAERGRRLVVDREAGNCLICHPAPIAGEAFQGDIAPNLAGVGARLDSGRLRFRLVDPSQLNAETLMPAYHRIDGLTRVAPRFAGKPVFTAQEIEDVVAWLSTLKD